jgi:ferric-dicitrate binding protein FerR (iron transport regulator)
MMRPDHTDPIWKLVDLAVAGELTEADVAELNQRLLHDADARQLFVDYCQLHAGLHFELPACHAAQAVDGLLPELLLTSCGPAEHAAATARSEHTGSTTLATSAGPASGTDQAISRAHSQPVARPSRSRLLLALAVAAAVACFAWIGQGWFGTAAEQLATNHSFDPQPTPPRDASPRVLGPLPIESPLVPLADSEVTVADSTAVVSGLLECQFAVDSSVDESGQVVQQGGSVAIDAGLLQLTFDSGVEVVLQGPAKVVVNNNNACQLELGSLVARVPAHASGFQLITPHADLVDLGTEFGARVRSDGRVDVHVFDGEVVLWKKRGRSDELRILAGHGVSIGPQGESLDYVTAAPQQFAHRVVPRFEADELPALPVTRNLALWLAADTLLTTDDQNRVIAWRDILAGDNQTNEDAWQQNAENRPLLVPSAMGGQPALRFDGTSDYFETAPLLTTHDQTLFFVFSRASDFEQPKTHQESLRTSRQLINYNGPVHAPSDPRYSDSSKNELQICDRISSGLFWGRVYATLDFRYQGVHLGSVAAKRRVKINEPTVLTYAFHPSRNQGALFLDGDLQGVDTAPLSREFTSRKVIGRSCAYEAYFHGDMAEILIYNGALTGDEIAQVNQYLGQKYSIAVESRSFELADQRPLQRQNPPRGTAPLVHIGNDPLTTENNTTQVHDN